MAKVLQRESMDPRGSAANPFPPSGPPTRKRNGPFSKSSWGAEELSKKLGLLCAKHGVETAVFPFWNFFLCDRIPRMIKFTLHSFGTSSCESLTSLPSFLVCKKYPKTRPWCPRKSRTEESGRSAPGVCGTGWSLVSKLGGQQQSIAGWLVFHIAKFADPVVPHLKNVAITQICLMADARCSALCFGASAHIPSFSAKLVNLFCYSFELFGSSFLSC